MEPIDVIKICISIPSDNGCIHYHTASFPYDGDKFEVKADDVLREFLYLMESVYGEMATGTALSKIKSQLISDLDTNINGDEPLN